MATFRVQNLTSDRLAVPSPLNVVLGPNKTGNADAASIDTPAVQNLIRRKLIVVTRVTDGGPGESAEVATIGLKGAASATTIGTINDPLVIGAAQTATLTHNIGAKASTIDVYDSNGANFTANADITVAQATANALTVTSTAGGSFVIVISFEGGILNDLGSALPSTDSHIVIA